MLLTKSVSDSMSKVYVYMAGAVANSMVVGYLINQQPDVFDALFDGWFSYIVIFSPLILLLPMLYLLRAGVSTLIGLVLLHLFAGAIGLSLSLVFHQFTLGSVYEAFMGAVILFGTLSAYGYFTQKDLSSWGSILLVGLISIIIVSLFNLWLGNSMLSIIISIISTLIFLGLTAYDTQQIREMILNGEPNAEISGALMLYLDFINIFMNLIKLFGDD